MTKPRSIVLADDHPIFRRGLVDIISEHAEFKVVAEAADGGQALDAIQEYHPDIAILDISMPVLDGFEVLLKAQHNSYTPRFIMLTMYDDKVYLEKALEYGAMGYLLKDNAEQELFNCLNMVEQGKHYLSPGVSRHLLEPQQPVLEILTPTERKIFILVSEFKTNTNIANLLAVSIRTIENHRARICKKLGLSGPHALSDYIASLSDKS